jgi:hypothetical protein
LFETIEVNPRISEKHPEILEVDVLSAWRNALIIIERAGIPLPDVVLVAVGSDANGRLIEMVGAVLGDGTVHVFHAMTPPSKKTLQEIGITGDEGRRK